MVPLVVLRLLSAVTAVPAFFEPGVPAAVEGLVAGLLALTALGVVLVLAPRRAPAVAGAR